jgi:hypothetical protein
VAPVAREQLRHLLAVQVFWIAVFAGCPADEDQQTSLSRPACAPVDRLRRNRRRRPMKLILRVDAALGVDLLGGFFGLPITP